MKVRVGDELWKVVWKTRQEGDVGRGYIDRDNQELCVYDDDGLSDGEVFREVARLTRAVLRLQGYGPEEAELIDDMEDGDW